MSNFDLSGLNSADKQELIIQMLIDTQALVIALLDRENERLTKEYDMSADEARLFMLKQYADARSEIVKGYGLVELPVPQRSPGDES